MLIFSDFVATRILHELYRLCCEKRFRPYHVQKIQPEPKTTLYKYLIIPKEAPTPPEPQLLQPSSPDQPLASSTNSSAPPPLPRLRSGTLPFITSTDEQQRSSKRAPSRPPKEDEKTDAI